MVHDDSRIDHEHACYERFEAADLATRFEADCEGCSDCMADESYHWVDRATDADADGPDRRRADAAAALESAICWTFPTIEMAHGSNNAPEGTVEGAVAAFEAATNTQLEASAVTDLRANSWVLHKWGAHQSESHAFVIWWPPLEVAANLLEDATCSIDYIRISDEPFTEGRAHEDHVEVCTRGTLAPTVDIFWALRGGTAIMKYLASGVGGEDNSVVAPPRSTTSARERAEALFMADGRDALSTQQCLTLQGMYSSSSNDSDDEGEANSDSDGTEMGDQTEVAVQAAVTAPQQDTGGLNAWLRDGETARAPSATRQAHPGGRVSSNKAEAFS
jgi:hypothetical protein